MQPSDEVLVAQVVVLADSMAFETLMRRHQQRIGYLLQRFTRDPALAEELCQETFLRAWRKLASFRGSGSFAAWLTRLAYNVFLQDLRRRKRQPAANAGHVETATRLDESQPELDRLLASVSADEQRLLILTYAAGLSASEIGAMLDMPAGTVKSLVHRAKDKIRRHFGIEVTS